MSARVKPYNFIVMIHNYGIKIKGGGGGRLCKGFCTIKRQNNSINFLTVEIPN